jgi:acetyl esterase/lipase
MTAPDEADQNATAPPPRRRLGCIPIMLSAMIVIIGLWALWPSGTVAMLDRVDGFYTQSLPVERSAYGPHPAQHLFVHGAGPAEAKPRPVLIFIHGGGWATGDPAEYAFIGRNFVPHGYVVVIAGYRLDRAGRFPAMLEDAAAAIAWTRANVARRGGDPERIFLMGHSAGAYNVVMTALDPQWLARYGLKPDVIKGVIGLSGPYDFAPFDQPRSIKSFGHVAATALTQPVLFANPQAPPILLASGDKDTTVFPRESLAMAAALTRAGSPNKAILFKGMGHVDLVRKLARPFDRDMRVKQTVLDFLARHSGAESVPPAASAPVQGNKG